ncbi:glycosyltransferase [Desertivirga xinjiangensis]|uniref:glycosyltransferase n=1 Tax=Desertivirga xinjiangensis TaxID=539206 RepID=UPI00210AAB91|nr:glycosyltransferase [Pedobacter xinjiangensis]
MTDPEKILFISDRKYVDFHIPGGVQLCTSEYLTYLSHSGHDPIIIKLDTTKSFLKKIKIKFGLEVYDRYDFNNYTTEIVNAVKKHKIKTIALNQINLAPLIEIVKHHLPSDVKFVGLSHGNESGDYLHDIAREKKPGIIETWKLGRQIVLESSFFRENFDGIIVISEHEIPINQWIGALNQLHLPRILQPGFLSWTPREKNAGFVGTLDHLPNKLGLELLCDSLKKSEFNYSINLVGGPEPEGRRLELLYPFIKYKGRLSNEQLEKEVSHWSIFLNPVFWYSRGASTKLAQAINWGIPVLSTPAGKRGYILSDETIITASNSPTDYSKALIEALDDQFLLDKLKMSTECNAKNFELKTWSSKLNTFIKNL